MASSMSERCRACVRSLREVISALSKLGSSNEHVKQAQVNEEFDRFVLFVGNIGGFHEPESPMSVDSRLHEAKDVLNHIFCLLDDLNETTKELYQIVSGKRQGMTWGLDENENGKDLRTSEDIELRDEIGATITRLFRVTTLVRQAASTDPFAKALSRDRYHFNDQFDIAHVGQRYPNLATDNYIWLRQRLGTAITHRRRYLSYKRDHHDKLESETAKHAPDPREDTTSRPSFATKATTIPDQITLSSLHIQEPDSEDDTRSYTTMSRSLDGNDDPSITARIPKLADLRSGSENLKECPFCFQFKKFKNESVWRKHVFSDIRPYVCTFPDCDASYFGDINKWFQHEMTYHRVAYRCFLCQDAVFHREKDYVAHLKMRHPDDLGHAESEQNKTLAREPLSKIPAADCPCCTDWVDRLRGRAGHTDAPTSDKVLTVAPTLFKRHLAKHLEYLAVFAIPTSAAADDPVNSNDANEVRSDRTAASQLSILSFSSEDQHDDNVSDGDRSSGSGQSVVITSEHPDDPLPQPQPQSQPEPQPEPQPESQPHPQSHPQSQPQIELQTESQPQPEWSDAFQRYLITLWNVQYGRYYWQHYVEGQGWVFFDWLPVGQEVLQARSRSQNQLHTRDDSVREVKASGGGTAGYARGEMVYATYNPTNPHASSHFETLDPSFHVRDGAFFEEGKVFSVLFTEPAGANALNGLNPMADYNTNLSKVKYDEFVHTQVRRFIVTKRKREFCFAVPIFTYYGQATTKNGVIPDEHAIAYSFGQQPQLVQGETPLRKSPIPIIMAEDSKALVPASRIYFAIHHPIQYNVKVKNIGHVHPDYLPTFLGYWNMENADSKEDFDVRQDPNNPDDF